MIRRCWGFLALAAVVVAACHAMEGPAAKEQPDATVVPAAPEAVSPAPEAAPAPDSVTGVLADAVVPVNDRHYGPAAQFLIDSARKSIHLCLYQVRFYDDYPRSTSNVLIDKLILARRRGVDVQVIVDTSPWKEDGNFDKENQKAAARMAQGGCRVYLDSPLQQSHEKLMVVDGRVTVVGSLNWSHYSLSSNREVAVMIWSDPIARAYEAYFARRLQESKPFTPPAAEGTLELQAEPGNETALATPEQIARAADVPVATDARITTLDNREYYPRLNEAITEAKQSISLVQDYAYYYSSTPKSDLPPNPEATPRLAPSDTNLLFNDLVQARKRGLKVRAIFDYSEYEGGGASFSGEDFANRLWALGVPAYHDDPAVRIHAKMLTIDDDKVVVGSTNWSFQAVEENNECSVLIESKTLGEYYGKWVEAIFARGYPVVMPIEKHESGARPVAPAPAPALAPAKPPEATPSPAPPRENE